MSKRTIHLKKAGLRTLLKAFYRCIRWDLHCRVHWWAPRGYVSPWINSFVERMDVSVAWEKHELRLDDLTQQKSHIPLYAGSPDQV